MVFGTTCPCTAVCGVFVIPSHKLPRLAASSPSRHGRRLLVETPNEPIETERWTDRPSIVALCNAILTTTKYEYFFGVDGSRVIANGFS